MSHFELINILDWEEAIGEDNVNKFLSDFLCSKNHEVENFVRSNALEFAKRKISITYLMIDENGYVIAFFTLTHKAIEIKKQILTKTMCKKIARYSTLDSESDTYTLSSFLIAQIGKDDRYKNSIKGDELMDIAMNILGSVQHMIGGGVIYLECENKEKLLQFYTGEPNYFKEFGKRCSTNDQIDYIQLLKTF